MAEAKAIVDDEPEAWRQRKMRSAGYEVCSASPIQAMLLILFDLLIFQHTMIMEEKTDVNPIR